MTRQSSLSIAPTTVSSQLGIQRGSVAEEVFNNTLNHQLAACESYIVVEDNIPCRISITTNINTSNRLPNCFILGRRDFNMHCGNVFLEIFDTLRSSINRQSAVSKVIVL